MTDILVLLVVVISGVWAFFRGFVLEVLGVAAWVGAAFISLFSFSFVRPFARQWIAIEQLADVTAAIVVFLIALVILSVISSAISSSIKSSSLSALDRSLGFAFGLVRGAALVSLAYLALSWLIPPPDHPDWIRQARTLPMVQQGALILGALVPRDTVDKGAAAAEQARRDAEQAIETGRRLQELTQPPPKADPGRDSAGYKNDDRRDLERLIEGKK